MIEGIHQPRDAGADPADVVAAVIFEVLWEGTRR